MKSILKRVKYKLSYYGFDTRKFLNALQKNRSIEKEENTWYLKDFEEIKKQQGKDESFVFGSMYPILTDKNVEGGVMNGHYFHQDLLVARLINLANPIKHLDIGSRTDGFIAHVASYRKIELIDIRPIKSQVKNISFRQANLMELPNNLIDYCDSISSLNAIEHFGLGRYGDPIDYFGHLKAINNIAKIVKSGGIFYFSVPIGPQRIEFNAHRIFSMEYLLDILSKEFILNSFSYVDDKGDLFENVELTDENIKSNLECQFGCGIFILIKK